MAVNLQRRLVQNVTQEFLMLWSGLSAFGCVLEQREHLETAYMLLLYHCIVHIFLFFQGPGGPVQLPAVTK